MKKTNRRISDLFYNNRFLLVFSVIAAIIVWLVVAVEYGEEIERKVRVKVTVDKNINGLIAYDVDDNYSVDVTVRGKKYIVESLNSDNISVTANTSQVNSVGVATLTLVPQSAETAPLYDIVGISQDTLSVFFDYPKEKEFKIETEINFKKSAVPDGYIMSDFVLSDTYTVKVNGPETEVNKIEKVVASATLEGGYRQTENFSAKLTAVTKDGSTPSRTSFSVDSVQVIAPVYKKMMLPVTCSFSNSPMEYLDKPFVVTVSPAMVNVGVPEDQAEGKQILELASKIDFSSLKSGVNTFTIPANSGEVSGGILLDEIEDFVVTVKVDGMSEKIVNVPSDTVVNVPDGVEMEFVSVDFDNVTIVGPYSEISNLNSDNLVFTADFSSAEDAETGETVSVPVKIFDGKCWVYGNYTAKFIVL